MIFRAVASGRQRPNPIARTYSYDAIGNLTKDTQAGITGINWNVYGKMKSITRSGGNISYGYDAGGNRVSKTLGSTSTYYVRDAQGNPLAVYEKTGSATVLKERQLYGSSRLGMWKPDANLADGGWNYLGLKFFELSNHLGNVMAVVTDKRIAHSGGGYGAELMNANDYYAFGGQMPGRSYLADSSYAQPVQPPPVTEVYRHGFETGPYSHPYTVAGDMTTGIDLSVWINSYLPTNWKTYDGVSNSGTALGLSSSSQDTAVIRLNLRVAEGKRLTLDSYSFYNRSSSTGYGSYSIRVNGEEVGTDTLFRDEPGKNRVMRSTGTKTLGGAAVSLSGIIEIDLRLTDKLGTQGTFRIDQFVLNGYVEDEEAVLARSNGRYRYGFNGKENDNEVEGQQDYGMRIYDRRIGRFKSVDPITKEFPELTPYQFASNTPIQAIDLDGLEAWVAIYSHYGKNTPVLKMVFDENVKNPGGVYTVHNYYDKVDGKYTRTGRTSGSDNYSSYPKYFPNFSKGITEGFKMSSLVDAFSIEGELNLLHSEVGLEGHLVGASLGGSFGAEGKLLGGSFKLNSKKSTVTGTYAAKETSFNIGGGLSFGAGIANRTSYDLNGNGFGDNKFQYNGIVTSGNINTATNETNMSWGIGGKLAAGIGLNADLKLNLNMNDFEKALKPLNLNFSTYEKKQMGAKPSSGEFNPNNY